MRTKHLVYLAAAALVLSCTPTDLSEVNGKINALQDQIDKLDDRIAANENAIRVLQKAGTDALYIEKVERFESADGSRSGWTIIFTDKTSVTIYDGLDGEAGQGAAIDVEVGEDSVTFILPGETIVIPLSKAFRLEFKEQKIGLAAGQTLSLDYTITGATPETTVDYIGGLDYKITITPAEDKASGKVEITAPDPVVSDRIAIIADDNNGHTSVKVIVIDALNVYAIVTDITADPIPAEGGTVEATITSNIDGYTLDIDVDWLAITATKAETTLTYTFTAQPNESYEGRTANVAVKDAEGTEVQKFSFFQQAKEFDPGNGTEENPYRLRTYDELCNLRDKMIWQGDRLDNPQFVYVELASDIDCGGRSMYEVDGSGERPIHFDGKGHTVSNIGVHRMTMFGFLWGTIKNLNIDNAHWNGSNYYEGDFAAGEHGGILCATVGLVGWGRNHAGHVENVHIYNSSVEYGCNPGDVGWNGSAGIICGELAYEGSSIVNCSAENCTVTGDFMTGLLVGVANGKCGKVTIENCFTSGTVNGGAVLPTGDSGGDFLNPFSINSYNVKLGYTGGIVGGAHNAEIKNCYSTAAVNNTDTERGVAGDIAGVLIQNALVKNCWSGGEIHSTVNGGGIVGSSSFYISEGNAIEGCIAWNDLVANANGPVDSGPVAGWFHYGANGGGGATPNTATGNYSKTSLVVTIEGNPVDRSADAYDEATGYGWVTGTQTDDIIGAAKAIGWDESIWDLSGELPVLKWQK